MPRRVLVLRTATPCAATPCAATPCAATPCAATPLAFALVLDGAAAVVLACLSRLSPAGPGGPLIATLVIALLVGLDALTHRPASAAPPRATVTVDRRRRAPADRRS